jgi:hypothetical protein
MQSVRDVTYQLLRELGLTTFSGNVGSTEETFLLKNFPSASSSRSRNLKRPPAFRASISPALTSSLWQRVTVAMVPALTISMP